MPNIAEAARLMHNMIVADDLVEFLAQPAYELLADHRGHSRRIAQTLELMVC